jgi:hypothetical protein
MNRMTEAIKTRDAMGFGKADAEAPADRLRDAWPEIFDGACSQGYITEDEAETAKGTVSGWTKAAPSERWAARTLAWEMTCAMRLGVDESGGQLRARSTTTRKQAHRKRKA